MLDADRTTLGVNGGVDLRVNGVIAADERARKTLGNHDASLSLE